MDVKEHIKQQLDRLYEETRKLELKTANGWKLDKYYDFEGLVQVRNSLVFLSGLIPSGIVPNDCDIVVSEIGNAYPVKKVCENETPT